MTKLTTLPQRGSFFAAAGRGLTSQALRASSPFRGATFASHEKGGVTRAHRCAVGPLARNGDREAVERSLPPLKGEGDREAVERSYHAACRPARGKCGTRRKLCLTRREGYSILIFARFGGVAQLARACGSYPQCHRFKSSRRYHARRTNNPPAGHPPARWSSG